MGHQQKYGPLATAAVIAGTRAKTVVPSLSVSVGYLLATVADVTRRPTSETRRQRKPPGTVNDQSAPAAGAAGTNQSVQRVKRVVSSQLSVFASGM